MRDRDALALARCLPYSLRICGDTQGLGARREFALPGGLDAELFAVPGKVALYLEGDDPALAAETGANVGVELVCGARRLVYVPGAAGMTAALRARLLRAVR